MKEQDNIEHLFKSAFDDFAVAPPASVKESIDLAVALRRKKKFTRWFFAGVIAFVILFVTGVSMLDNERQETRMAQKEATSSQQDNPEISENSTSGTRTNNQQNKAAVAGDSSTKTKSAQEAQEKHPSDNKFSSQKSASQNSSIGQQASKASGAENKTSGKTKKTVSGKTGRNPHSGNSRQASVYPSKGKGSKRGKSGASSPGKRAAFENPFTSATVSGTGGPTKGIPSKTTDPETAGNPNNPAKTAAPESKAPENKTEPVTPKDSVGVQPVDSSVTAAVPAPEKPKSALEKSLLFSLRGGPGFGFNSLKSTDAISRKLSEKNGFFIHAEATYLLKPNWGFTSGLNYEHRIENFSAPVNHDSVIYTYAIEYIYDSTQTVIDSIVTTMDSTLHTASTQQNSYKIYAISLPVLFTYTAALTPKLNLDLSAGAILSLQGSKVISEQFDQGITVNKFGMKACVRAQMRYQFSQWGVSLNTNFGYDVIPVSSWQGIKRSRTYLDFGVGVHYLLSK